MSQVYCVEFFHTQNYTRKHIPDSVDVLEEFCVHDVI